MIFLLALCKLSPQTLPLMRYWIVLLGFMLLFYEIKGQQKPDFAPLETYLMSFSSKMRINIQVESLDGYVYFSQQPQEMVPSASVIKIPILVELMEQVKAGHFQLEDKYILADSDKVGGSGVLSKRMAGEEMNIDELARLMMIASDNTATNVIIRKVGRENINQRSRSLGLESLQLNRLMMDTAAVARGIDNYVTCRDINTLLRLIYHQKVATPMLCERMMGFLYENQDTLTLPRLIPKHIKIAHKTGGLAYVRGDAGIVFGEVPFVISVFIRDTKVEEAEKMLGEIGEICFEILNKNN